MVVSLLALLIVHLLRQLSLKLSLQHEKKEVPMNKTKKTAKVVLNTSLKPDMGHGAGTVLVAVSG
jgi:hypothetical protein